MKGVVLAGGTGTRLYPMTTITNKHLLPVVDRPMIFYPLQVLVKAGIKDVMIITGDDYHESFKKLLGDGGTFIEHLKKIDPSLGDVEINITYTIQDKPGGISHALKLAKDFVGKENCVVILGDNVFEDDITESIKEFESVESGAFIMLKEIPEDYLYETKYGEKRARFGIADVKEDKIIRIIEKPTLKESKSNLAVTGIYMYTPDVFDKLEKLKPSWRNELEISDINEMYVKEHKMKFKILKGFWSDVGNVVSLNKTIIYLYDKRKE